MSAINAFPEWGELFDFVRGIRRDDPKERHLFKEGGCKGFDMDDLWRACRSFYYDSPKWKDKQEQVFKRDQYRCQECKRQYDELLTGDELEVHHKHYSNTGREPLKDLITLCSTCHRNITKEKRARSNGNLWQEKEEAPF